MVRVHCPKDTLVATRSRKVVKSITAGPCAQSARSIRAPLAAGPPLSVSSLAGEQAGHGRVKICKRLANSKTKMNKVATPEQVEQNQLCGSIALQHKHEKEHDMELAELIENNDESPNRVDNNKTRCNRVRSRRHVSQPICHSAVTNMKS